jgi:uncharacterized protein YfaS (alpha-2-macroglobulin family)
MKPPFFRRATPTLFGLLLGLAMAAPVIGQRESEPYFSLSSDRTFGVNQTPAIYVAGSNVAAVQIRVYRVKNPVEFYSKLEDSHIFSRQEQRRIQKNSFLGNVRIWKHDLRRRIRLFLRGQFTESVSAHFRSPKTPEPKPSANTRENYFAETPLLNRDQLVLSFIQPLSKGRWSSANVPIHVKDKGVYLVEAVSGGLRAYTIVIKSNLVLVTKVGRERITAFVADRDSGEPVSGATLLAMTRNRTPSSFTTNTDGLADIKANPDTGTTSDDLRVVARKGDDVNFNALTLCNICESAHTATGYIYTDRPVYRPGDTIHFRGILRFSKSPGGYDIPAGRSFPVQIQGPDGKAVYTKHLIANSNGIIHDELSTEKVAALGNYFIQVGSNRDSMTGNFEVQDYKKPEYEVHVIAAAPRVLEGQKLDITINARYYFGEAVANAKVEYSLYRTRYFYPLWRDPDDDSTDNAFDQGNDEEAGEEVLKANGQLDADGNLHVSYQTTVSEHHSDYQYRVEARVTDEARREISGRGWAVATYGTFLVNVEPQRYFYNPSETGALALKAVDYDGKPVSTPVHISIVRISQRKNMPPKVVSTVHGNTGGDGNGTASISVPAEGGSNKITISARSGNGRIVESSSYIWVAGSGESALFSDNSQAVQIVPDKKRYAPGETAKILIVTGKPNTPVLVAVEGTDVRFIKLLRSEGPTVSFEYPISANDEPGFFISAQFVRNGVMHQGQRRVVIPPEDHKLDIQIVTDKPQYQPGQTATYNLKVTTPDGQAVANADLSLGVVDEAIYAIRPDTSPDLLKFFYGNPGSGVNSQDSLTYYFSGEAGNRRMLLAYSTAGHRPLAQLKREPLVRPKIRKAFPDTSYWAADLTTDSAGHVQAKVALPDSLTTWRATVKGATAEERFGEATSKTIVRKNVIMRLAIPRFFVAGDEVVISGIVHNYLPNEKQAQVSVALNGLTLLSGNATQDVTVPSHGEARVDWRVKALNAENADITGKALTNEESDALEMSVPIHPQGLSIRQSNGGSIAAGASVTQAMNFASDAEPGSRSISIRLSSSVAGSIFNALDFLTSFPYGCTEQTMSSFLPDLMVARASQTLKGLPPIDKTTLNKQVNAGLDRLYDMQHEDGGWGWWPSDASHPFMTAYVVAGLAEAARDGINIKDEALRKGITWLQNDVRKDADLQPDMKAYIAYALAEAGKADSALAGRIYSARSTLSPYGVALLGLAFDIAKDRRAASLADNLRQSVKQQGGEAWWVATRDEMLDLDADVSTEATAYAVKLLTHERKDDPLLPKAALWLVNHRNEGYWWSSSKQTAMVIYGLLDYVKATNELNADFTATVSINGKTVASQKFTAGSPTAAPEIFIPESKLQPGANQIRITTSGNGRLYYSATGTHYSNAARMEKQGAVSLNVLRDYFRLVPINEGDHIVYDLAPWSGPAASGDIIAARLTVTGSNWKYLLVEDPIPAGTEFIENDNLYQIRSRPPWWRWSFSRRELHDDHMAIFQTFFSQGQQQYFYLLKVVNPGLFHVNPARVAPMYQPGISATTESTTVEVKP